MEHALITPHNSATYAKRFQWKTGPEYLTSLASSMTADAALVSQKQSAKATEPSDQIALCAPQKMSQRLQVGQCLRVEVGAWRRPWDVKHAQELQSWIQIHVRLELR